MTERFTPEQWNNINTFFNILAVRTRKSKKISESRQQNIIKEWADFDIDVVMESIIIFMNMQTTMAQNEKYIKGIMRNKQKEKVAKSNEGCYRNNCESKKSTGISQQGEDEGERLQQFVGKCREAVIQCDF